MDKNCFDWAKIGSSLEVSKNAGGAATSYMPHHDSDKPLKIKFKVLLLMIKEIHENVGLENCIKSVHLKKTVTQFSFLSKVLSFLLKSKQSQRKCKHF